MIQFRPKQIREVVTEALSELSNRPASNVTESLLIREGHYCGHRYQFEDHSAIWFIEENQIKFYNASGKMVRVVEPGMLKSRQSLAA